MRAVTLTLLLCAGTCPALAQDVSAVTQASQKFAGAMSGGDPASAAEMFADDASMLPPGRGEVTGKPQIQRVLTNMGRFLQDPKYTSETIKPIGDAGASEVGTLSFKTKPRNGKTPQDITGKYLIVWAKAGSDWKITAEMWNRSGGGRGPGGQGGRKGQGITGGQNGGQNGGGADGTGIE